MGDDASEWVSDHAPMTDPEPDWHLQAWAEALDKKQASLTNELGWSKNKANKIWHSRQPYRRDLVNEVAAWLGIEPYELLMAPDKAMALRQLRQTAYAIAAEVGVAFEGAPIAAPAKPGKGG